MRGLTLNNIVNKAASLNLNLNATDFCFLDFERVYQIKKAYDEVMMAKHKGKR
jgi:hypothetical protein